MTVEFEDVEVVHTTDLALRCKIDGVKHWIPKSEIDEESELDAKSERGDEGTLVIPEWLATEKELV